MSDLRQGRWQEVLADVAHVDALICDPPYSARTHMGIGTGWHPGGAESRPYKLAPIVYDHWADPDAVEFVRAWAPRTRGWMVVMSDHETALTLQQTMRDQGRYVFAPLPFIEMGKQPRVNGDGPASWTCWIVVSRPREKRFMSWGSLPGAYIPAVGPGTRDRVIKGGKPLWLMRALVRDYSRQDDLVCDPFVGGGTTLLASDIEHRKAVGAEQDAATYKLAKARLSKGFTPSLFVEEPGRTTTRHSAQLGLPLAERCPVLFSSEDDSE